MRSSLLVGLAGVLSACAWLAPQQSVDPLAPAPAVVADLYPLAD